MEEVIPPVLLVTVGDRQEVPPRKHVVVADEKRARASKGAEQ